MARVKINDISERQVLADGETDLVVGGYCGYYGGGYGWGWGGPSYYHDTSHFDYHPGGFYRHGNHFHYMPGHYDWHNTGHWH